MTTHPIFTRILDSIQRTPDVPADTTELRPVAPCHVCGTPGCEGQCSLPPMVPSPSHYRAPVPMARNPVPPVVAEFAAEMVEAQSTRCLRHSWELIGSKWNAEDPAHYHCRKCRIDADEIEVELSEAREQIEALAADVNKETERADYAETAAKLNADTIAGQQQHVRQLEETNGRLRGKVRHFTEMQTELESAVVVLRSNHRRTLWSLLETGDFEPLCVTCHDPTCESCTPPDAVLQREAAEDEGDES